jgi:hypothetical protein
VKASTTTTTTSTSSADSASKEFSAPLTWSNIGSAASLGDLADLLDGVSFGSGKSSSSGRILRISNSRDITNNETDVDNSTDSGIRKVDSCFDFYTDQIFPVRHQMFMVNIGPVDGQLEDATDEEDERDAHENPRFDPNRIDRDGRNSTQSGQHQTPPKPRGNGGANAGGGNNGNTGNNGANGGGAEIPHAEDSQRRARPLVELSQETWNKARDAIAGRCFLGENATRDKLLAYRYLLYLEKKEIRRMRQELDERKERANESIRRRAALSSIGNSSVGAGNCNRRTSSRLRNIPKGERQEMTQQLELSFMSIDSRGNIQPKMPQAAMVACQTYLMITQPPNDDPRAATHRTALASLNIVGQHLEGTPRQEVAPPRRHASPRQEEAPRRSRSPRQPRVNM